jgi:hypothetical protein
MAGTRARGALAVSERGAGAVSLLGVDPATHERHHAHALSRTYQETNCYADILIELLHARGDEPLAVLGCTVSVDFEGDQFTFFKPAESEIDALFGIDIHEMQPYRPLPQQAREQLCAGRTLIVELDSFHLPDTAATSYHTEHVKSSVIIESIDVDAQWMRYFHNAGIYDLDGDDYRGVFRLTPGFSDDVLPPYTELVRFDSGPRLRGDDVRAAARHLLDDHLAHRPSSNPFSRFGEQLAVELPSLVAGDPAGYHAYAFATVRMAGASFQVASSYVLWLLGERGRDAADAFDRIVEGCKTLSFKLARRRTFDPEPAISTLAAAWSEAQERLDAALA